MANIKSAAKRARQAVVRKDRNQQSKKAIRSLEKKFVSAVNSKNKDAAIQLLREYSSKIGKAAQKGRYHAKTASRKISRLTLFMNKSLG